MVRKAAFPRRLVPQILSGVEDKDIIHGGFFQVDCRDLDAGIPQCIDNHREYLCPILVYHQDKCLFLGLSVTDTGKIP